ncbi:MAG: hypothetical protein AB2L20_17030 [Mangrovibacterium sp.]
MEYFTKTIERIFHFARFKGISINKFSTQVGVSNSYFTKMRKNNASVGSDIIEKILRIYPELNAEWLLTGTGDILKATKETRHKEDTGIATERELQHSSSESREALQELCLCCKERERIIDALKTALNAKQGEINALLQSLEDKERLIKFLTKSDENINKQIG